MLSKKTWQNRFKKALLEQRPMNRHDLRSYAHYALECRNEHMSPQEAVDEAMEISDVFEAVVESVFDDPRDRPAA